MLISMSFFMTACQWEEVDMETGDVTISYFSAAPPGSLMQMECLLDIGSFGNFRYGGLGTVGSTQWNSKHPKNPVYSGTATILGLFDPRSDYSHCVHKGVAKYFTGNWWIQNGYFYEEEGYYTKYSADLRVVLHYGGSARTQTTYFTESERSCFNKHSSSNYWTRASDCNKDKKGYFRVEGRTPTQIRTVNRGKQCKGESDNWYSPGMGYACTTVCANDPDWNSQFYLDGGAVWWSKDAQCSEAISDDGAVRTCSFADGSITQIPITKSCPSGSD